MTETANPAFWQRAKAPLPVYYSQLIDDAAVLEEVESVSSFVSCDERA